MATGLAPRFTPRTHATELNNCPGAGPRALSIRLSRAAASPTHGATPRTPRYVAVFTRPARARTRQLRVGTRRARTVRWGGLLPLPTHACGSLLDFNLLRPLQHGLRRYLVLRSTSTPRSSKNIKTNQTVREIFIFFLKIALSPCRCR